MSVSFPTSNNPTSNPSPPSAQLESDLEPLSAAAGHETQHATGAAALHTGPQNFNSGPRAVAHTEPTGANPDAEEIEMAPIGSDGGRRQRASLADTVTGAAATASSSRRRSPRPRDSRQGTGLDGAVGSEQDSLSDEDKDGYDLSDEDLHDDEEAGLTGRDRTRKRDKRARNTQLDQRIVKDGITRDEIKEADKSVLKNLVINGVLIGLWYLFSLSISLVSLLCTIWSLDKLLTQFPSITNGCLIQKSSTFPFLCSQPLHT